MKIKIRHDINPNRYYFDELRPGIYNVHSHNECGEAFHPSIIIVPEYTNTEIIHINTNNQIITLSRDDSWFDAYSYSRFEGEISFRNSSEIA
jgi:hypothetical protein